MSHSHRLHLACPLSLGIANFQHFAGQYNKIFKVFVCVFLKRHLRYDAGCKVLHSNSYFSYSVCWNVNPHPQRVLQLNGDEESTAVMFKLTYH